MIIPMGRERGKKQTKTQGNLILSRLRFISSRTSQILGAVQTWLLASIKN